VGSIVGFVANPQVGVATTNGRAYYRISSLLKRINIPFSDIVLDENCDHTRFPRSENDPPESRFKIVITTKKERLRFGGNNVVCEEDLGLDAGVAKEKLISILYPPKPEDRFVVGIDPGQRTGLAAFINQREIESSVFPTIELALARTATLLENAPDIRKVVKIGRGNPLLARRIARALDGQVYKSVEINLVNEDGTSALRKKGRFTEGTRDQRAAKLIAFRAGEDYHLP
jgi:hypothetical protein